MFMSMLLFSCRRDTVEASRIARRAGQARVAAVSFDVRLHPFVKEYLEPLIGSDLVYHTWELNLSLADPDFLEKLAATAFFRDPRVETILVEYRSELMRCWATVSLLKRGARREVEELHLVIQE